MSDNVQSKWGFPSKDEARKWACERYEIQEIYKQLRDQYDREQRIKIYGRP